MENTMAGKTLLIVDDSPENIDVLGGILKEDYKVKFAVSGAKALKIARGTTPPDLILLDIMMPEMDGYEVCEKLKRNALTKNIPVIFVTSKNDTTDESKGFEAGCVDYIRKPVSPALVQARIATHLALYDKRRMLEEIANERTAQLLVAMKKLKSASLDTIHRLSRAAEYKDEDTGSHILRMSNYAATVARTMGFQDDFVESILYAAPLHDIGKIGTPDRILLKPGKLDADEWVIMKRHTTDGARILEGSDADFIKMGRTIAISHHEKWDGSGYPNGLKGEGIPIEGRITAIADVFDALTSKRPYKKPFPMEKAYAIITESKGSHFDPQVVDAFFEVEDEILEIKGKYQDNGKSFLVRFGSSPENN